MIHVFWGKIHTWAISSSNYEKRDLKEVPDIKECPFFYVFKKKKEKEITSARFHIKIYSN